MGTQKTMSDCNANVQMGFQASKNLSHSLSNLCQKATIVLTMTNNSTCKVIQSYIEMDTQAKSSLHRYTLGLGFQRSLVQHQQNIQQTQAKMGPNTPKYQQIKFKRNLAHQVLPQQRWVPKNTPKSTQEWHAKSNVQQTQTVKSQVKHKQVV